MDHRRADGGGRCGDGACTGRVDREGKLGLVLRTVDGGVGGGRHDDVGPCGGDRRGHRPGPCKVQLGPRRRQQVDLREIGHTLRQAARDLAVSPGDQQPHGAAFSAMPSLSPA